MLSACYNNTRKPLPPPPPPQSSQQTKPTAPQQPARIPNLDIYDPDQPW